MGDIINEVYDVLRSPDEARQKRINKMVAIYKYNFKWSRKVFIDKVLEWIPELKSKINDKVHRYSSTKGLYAAMEITDMNTVLTRLESIESSNNRRNKPNGNSPGKSNKITLHN